jgi:hypothetical protein
LFVVEGLVELTFNFSAICKLVNWLVS